MIKLRIILICQRNISKNQNASRAHTELTSRDEKSYNNKDKTRIENK